MSATGKGAGHAWQYEDYYRGIGRSRRLRDVQGRHRADLGRVHVKVAEYPQPKKTVWLEQNVSREQLNWFYHADQGTRTLNIPYEWFMTLEQPTIPWLIFTSVAPFKDPIYLDRYGFIPVPEQKVCFRSALPMAARCWIHPARPGAIRPTRRT